MSVESILNGVEDTLYIPLVGRIYATKKFPEFFYDEKALSLESHIPTDSIDKNSNKFFYMSSVIEIRKRVLGNGNNENFISGDMFRLDWIKEIDTTLPTLISVSGVYQYFVNGK